MTLFLGNSNPIKLRSLIIFNSVTPKMKQKSPKLIVQLKHRLIDIGLLPSPKNCYIISYPKSGRTWLRLMIGTVLCEQFALDQNLILQIDQLTQQAKRLRTVFTHDDSALGDTYNYRELNWDKSNYANQKVIFLVRDPRDVLVSSYFQVKIKLNRFDGTLSEFIRHDRWGINKILTFYKIWSENQNTPYKFLLIRYEDMHQDTAGVLRSVLNFMEIPDIPDSLLIKAVEDCKINKLRKAVVSGQYDQVEGASSVLKEIDKNNPESYKFRKGKVKGYVDYLSPEDIDFVNHQIEQFGQEVLFPKTEES